MQYPLPNEIDDPRTTLPRHLAVALDPCFEQAQWRYREFYAKGERWPETPAINILGDVAVCVFNVLVDRALNRHADDFEAFRTAISLERGAAETGFRAAHFLYKDVEGGRMLAIWHRQIQDRLQTEIKQAEHRWWQNHMAAGSGANRSQPESGVGEDRKAEPTSAKPDPEVLAAQRQAVVMPILDEKRWSMSDWADQADVDANTVTDYLKGRTLPHRRTRVKLAAKLGIRVEQLPK